MSILAFAILVLAAAIPGMFNEEEIDDCEGEWDESFVDRSDDIGESA